MSVSDVKIDAKVVLRMKERILEIEAENANESRSFIIKKIREVIENEVSKCY
jgi:hypothetical protein